MPIIEISSSDKESCDDEFNVQNFCVGLKVSENDSSKNTERKETLSDKSPFDGPTSVSENSCEVEEVKVSPSILVKHLFISNEGDGNNNSLFPSDLITPHNYVVCQKETTSQQEEGAQQEDTPQPPVADIPFLAPPPFLCTLALFNAIHRLSLHVDAQFDALIAHVNDQCNLLEEYIMDLSS
ncbi:hypothetical protein Godav_020876 [Gossypium davidsonii]|uniref:Uncharacterized protein n=1 Tax=Gossypium davidsonii TaxID=34287 RepID=A0A7J8R4P5_GOSDV|nr:hypothetical protein [Gossypium davidsonii]